MASKDRDQLGTLPPGTLTLVLFDRYPYWPSVILSRTEARAQPALREQLLAAEVSGRQICAVRFFGVNTCAIVSVTDVEPLIVKRFDCVCLLRVWELAEVGVLQE
jgi:hypothetical protein